MVVAKGDIRNSAVKIANFGSKSLALMMLDIALLFKGRCDFNIVTHES